MIATNMMKNNYGLFQNKKNTNSNKNSKVNKTSCCRLSTNTSISGTTSSTSSGSDSTTLLLIPGQLGFQNAHALINKERVRRGRDSLQRNVHLDHLCSLQAQHMAERGELSYTAQSLSELRELVGSAYAGENIQRGPSVLEMHMDSMKDRNRSAFKNILNRRFVEFGVGTARGKHDGKLYMVQIFRGPRNDMMDLDSSSNNYSNSNYHPDTITENERFPMESEILSVPTCSATESIFRTAKDSIHAYHMEVDQTKIISKCFQNTK